MDTIELRAEIVKDLYLDLHGTTSHLPALARDERASLTIALGWVEIALAALVHHQKKFGHTSDATPCLTDAREYLEEERSVMARLGGTS